MNDDPLLEHLTPRVLLGGFVVCILLALVVAAVTSAVPFGPYNSSWDGSSAFRAAIDDESETTPVFVEANAYDRFNGNRSLIVVLAPRERYTENETDRLRAFLERGGTILVAEDQRTETNRLLEGIGATARVDGRPLRDPQQYYRSPALPVITNTTNTSVVRGVESFTINRGSVLRTGSADTLARTSGFAYLDQNGNGALDRNEELRSYPVLSSERVGNGRVLVLSDPSVFINRMLEREGNTAFVTQLVASHEQVAIDASHRPGTPPAVVLWLWLRRTAWAQSLLGLIVIGVVLLGSHDRVREWIRESVVTVVAEVGRSPSVESITLDPAERSQFLQRTHPEWDAERIERIARSMNRNDERDRERGREEPEPMSTGVHNGSDTDE